MLTIFAIGPHAEIPLDFTAKQSVHAMLLSDEQSLRHRLRRTFAPGLFVVGTPASGQRTTTEAVMPKTSTPPPSSAIANL